MVPARYRPLLFDGVYLTKGFERNLVAMTPTAFSNISRQISEKSYTDPTARLLKRYIFSNGDHVELDKAGRILIPQFLRDVADLGDDVVVVGVGDFFELWSPEQWSQQADNMADVDANVGRFIDYEISTS